MSSEIHENSGKWGRPVGDPPVAGKGPKADNPRRSYRSHRAKLQSVGDISHELGRIYREARAGKLDVAECSKLANVLAICARIITDSDLEARIERLEQGVH